jgi:hypothetical protein
MKKNKLVYSGSKTFTVRLISPESLDSTNFRDIPLKDIKKKPEKKE